MFDKYDDLAIGPIGKADAMLLHAVLNYIQPTIAVEYGCLYGDSTRIIAPNVGTLYAVDVVMSQEIRDYAAGQKHVILVEKRMEQWQPSFGELIDFVFFDAGHKFYEDAGAFVNIESWLFSTAIIAVHDTCFWPHDPPTPRHAEFGNGHSIHVRQERMFCDFLKLKGWNCVNFGTTKTIRHGLTFLQRN